MKICVIGLGYVGLPLAVEFGKKYDTVGFDVKESRIEELKHGIDRTLEVNTAEIKKAERLIFTSKVPDIKDCCFFIVCVPTPIDKYKHPDLQHVIRATETVGKALKRGDIVIYESTVYPGCTEEDCAPLLAKVSGLKHNQDFYTGYSPERINPGDKKHSLTNIKKVVSGSTPEAVKRINELYSSIITAGTHIAPSIKVAEAAKVIENSQRDINIAFINELSIIFKKLGIDTHEVLEVASTKWNFLNFNVGLVGGHCIGVDPYYLTFKAQALGYHPQIILAGRKINDYMGVYVAEQLIKLMIKKNHKIDKARVLMLGITFKENCPDIRNSLAIDVVRELKEFGCSIDIFDPWANTDEVRGEYSVDIINKETLAGNKYEAIVFAVAHDCFKDFDISQIKLENTVVYDVKGILNKDMVDGRL